jgi:ankyrin repeat protein
MKQILPNHQFGKMYLDRFYPDITKYLFSFLDVQSLGRMSQVTKKMKDIIYNENIDMRAERYIDNKTRKGKSIRTIFLNCCRKGGPLDVIKYIIYIKNIDPSANNDFAIRHSCRENHLEVVKLLLSDPRVDPGACDNHAIVWASYKGYLDLMKLLLPDSRVNPQSGVRWALKYGNYEVAKLLLSDPRVDPHQVLDGQVNMEIMKLLSDIKGLIEDKGRSISIT